MSQQPVFATPERLQQRNESAASLATPEISYLREIRQSCIALRKIA